MNTREEFEVIDEVQPDDERDYRIQINKIPVDVETRVTTLRDEEEALAVEELAVEARRGRVQALQALLEVEPLPEVPRA